jgi:catechol 2,3-dioxygenase-like lactoylglutathione lyase family enzyme
VSLVYPRTRRLAGWACVALFIVVFPANITMAVDSLHGHGSVLIAWLRLPLQVPLVLWALYIAQGGARPAGLLRWMNRHSDRRTMSLAQAHVATRLPAQDLDRAREWYSQMLGLEPDEEREGGLRYLVNGGEFCLFLSQGGSDGSFTQLAFSVSDVAAEVAQLKARGVVFQEYEFPGMTTQDSVVHIEGNYPSKGSAELGTWFKDSEGNMIGMSQSLP